MSNVDYKQSGTGNFATFVKTDVALSHLDTTIDYTEFNAATIDAIQPGMACLIDEEIIRIETTGIRTMTVKRGCADTVPTIHAAGSLVWIISGSVGSDKKERSAGEQIAVKIAPFTIGGGALPVAMAPPQAVTFNWRKFRPYPPAYLFANTARWFAGATINDTTGSMNLTWRDRNRVTQSDQLVGHDDAQVAPEDGTTYTLRIYDQTGTTLIRAEPGIRGNAFMYQHAKALKDAGYPASPVNLLATFISERDAMESLQWYFIPVTVEPSASPIPSQWQNFWQYVQETPYIFNARKGYSVNDARAMAVASRPSDRMSDGYNLIRHWVTTEDSGEVDGQGNPIYVQVQHNENVANGDYTPWFTLEFGVTELETEFNVSAMSLWDGVRLPSSGDLVGKIALIEEEFVEFQSLKGDVYTVGRGVGDTIPRRHIAGVGVVFFDHVSVVDPTGRAAGETHEYRFQPKTYGPLPDPNTLPVTGLNTVTFNNRALRPYNVAQLVVGGRPWYEEAQVVSGLPLEITWAWRNRQTQGSAAFDHTYPSIDPEAGTQAVLTFFYQTPPVNPGDPPVQHDLRTVVVSPFTIPGEPGVQDGIFNYTYAMAQADGAVAGAALGICGSVVITCAIYTIRGGYAAWQHYWIPIRVPSYPC